MEEYQVPQIKRIMIDGQFYKVMRYGVCMEHGNIVFFIANKRQLYLLPIDGVVCLRDEYDVMEAYPICDEGRWVG